MSWSTCSGPPGDDRWIPFKTVDGFNPRWWNQSARGKTDRRFIKVICDGGEVGRVRLHDRVNFQNYGESAETEARAPEIQLIEVLNQYGREGIATTIIRELESSYPERILVAYSMNADHFWDTLNWRRYPCPDKRGPEGSPLYVQQ